MHEKHIFIQKELFLIQYENTFYLDSLDVACNGYWEVEQVWIWKVVDRETHKYFIGILFIIKARKCCATFTTALSLYLSKDRKKRYT